MARILVLEDNAVNLELVTYLLEACQHQVRCARNGVDGLALARELQPELVLCDLQMPQLDGIGFAAALRADARLRHVPLIAVTAAAMVGDRERALAAGFDEHVPKPIDPQSLLQLVHRRLAAAAAASPTAAAAATSPAPAAPAPPAPGPSAAG